jgi:hypothetical protein
MKRFALPVVTGLPGLASHLAFHLVIAHEDQPKVKLVPVSQVPKNGYLANTGVKSGRALTLMIPSRITSGSAIPREAAAGYAYLPVVGWQPGTTLSIRRGGVEDPTNELYLSVVSAWEIQIQY